MRHLSQRNGPWIGSLLAASLVCGLPQKAVRAHEGHAALPSTGVTLDGDQLLVAPAALEAIGMKTAKITLGDLRHLSRGGHRGR